MFLFTLEVKTTTPNHEKMQGCSLSLLVYFSENQLIKFLGMMNWKKMRIQHVSHLNNDFNSISSWNLTELLFNWSMLLGLNIVLLVPLKRNWEMGLRENDQYGFYVVCRRCLWGWVLCYWGGIGFWASVCIRKPTLVLECSLGFLFILMCLLLLSDLAAGFFYMIYDAVSVVWTYDCYLLIGS